MPLADHKSYDLLMDLLADLLIEDLVAEEKTMAIKTKKPRCRQANAVLSKRQSNDEYITTSGISEPS
jgi:hypothetical protein